MSLFGLKDGFISTGITWATSRNILGEFCIPMLGFQLPQPNISDWIENVYKKPCVQFCVFHLLHLNFTLLTFEHIYKI